MSDDLVPEEGEPEYSQLLAVLRPSPHKRVPIAASEQAQIIARVRERLELAVPASALPDTGTLTPQLPFAPNSIPARPTRTPSQFLANLVAALVVIGIILGSWALFRTYTPSNSTPGSPAGSGSGPSAQAEAGGLEASMHVLIGGPYFLSELLPVDVSFTNHKQGPAQLDASVRIVNNSIADPCFPHEFVVQVTGGHNPSYTFPELDIGCVQPLFTNEVGPGQTMTIHQYVPLTKSGEVTLTTGMRLPDNPFNRLWPAVHVQMQVNPQVPRDRAIPLQPQPGRVTISAPAGARAHLLYMQGITCDGYDLSDPITWTPLSTNVLHEPACPAAHRHWTYIVSAPGYAIVSGSQTASSPFPEQGAGSE
ncbi:MAG TPA: hypothetical protein VKR06_09130 [Ktedonosporobacter sp.]|nr:hypothetical protein [Ktedonosporobacter sp.]